MRSSEHPPGLYDRYLRLLGVPRRRPGLDALAELTAAHLARIPFENVSKLYHRREAARRGLPRLGDYLDGIQHHHLGGTCYANNFHLNRLLAHLGYRVALCGADMSAPDVHLVNIVTLDGRRYLADVGYAAPFLAPLPLDLAHDHEIAWGRDRYVLKPRDPAGRWRLELHHAGVFRHSYSVNPVPRGIDEFAQVIADSFRPNATFMNALLIARFNPHRSVTLRNLALIEAEGSRWTSRQVPRSELPEVIESHFGIPREITLQALQGVALTEEP